MFFVLSGAVKLGRPVSSLSFGVASMRPGVRGVSSVLAGVDGELLRVAGVGLSDWLLIESVGAAAGVPLVVGRCEVVERGGANTEGAEEMGGLMTVLWVGVKSTRIVTIRGCKRVV